MEGSTLRWYRDALLTTTALVAASTLHATPARAQLSGLSVAAGQASVASSGKATTITTSDKSILNWQSFSIAAGTSVTFKQPSNSSISLNRVLGRNVSDIEGSLTATGQVWLINPNGVLFGSTAQVSVAGLLATTADIRDQDFLSGNYAFAGAPANASIVNKGHLAAASGGSVVLGAAHVDNQGIIEAQLGTVALGGGKAFTVDFSGDKLLSFQVTAPVDQTPLDADGQPVATLVSNSGRIAAEGGRVLMTARAAKNIIDNVINSSGIVEATSASLVNGEIVLDGGDGAVVVSGTLDASGKRAGASGGTVKVLGGQVALADGALIDVSGDQGGGTALIGGDFHGAGPDANAQTTAMAAGATINANALGAGTGGNVALWSDQSTSVAGTITARGGAAGGNGGLVETSGRNALSVAATARIDAGAAAGAVGTWLLDPADVTIGNAAGDVTPASIITGLAGGNVIISTDPNAAGTGTITIDGATGALHYTSANGLALLAQGSIIANAPVQNDGSGAVGLIAGWDGATQPVAVAQGGLSFAPILGNPAAFGTAGGNVTIGGAGATGDVAVGTAGAIGADGTTITGGDTVVAGANISLTSVNGLAQIGHAFGGNTGSNITVDATGTVTLLGGAGTAVNSFAEIGQGTALSQAVPAGGVVNAGSITVTGTGVTLQGGSGVNVNATFAAQIGDGLPGLGDGIHAFATGSTINSGNITVTATTGAVTLAGGTAAFGFAQIGHGQFGSAGSTISGDDINTGNITVTASTGVSLTAGTGGNSFVQIGHGGPGSVFGSTITGNVVNNGTIAVTAGTLNADGTVKSPGAVTLAAGTGTEAYAQIGHGGAAAVDPLKVGGSVTNSGDITVTASTDVSLTGAGSGNLRQNGSSAYAQIGHGGDFNGTNFLRPQGLPATIAGSLSYSGNIAVTAQTGSVTLTGGAGDDGYAQIGHGGAGANADETITGKLQITGAVTVNAAKSVTLDGGTGAQSYAQIGHGGAFFGNNQIMLLAGAASDEIGVLGVTGTTSIGDINSAINVTAATVALTGGDGTSYAQIGDGGFGSFGNARLGPSLTESGAITVATTGGVTVTGGSSVDAYAQIGHGGMQSSGPTSLATTVLGTGSISVQATSGAIDVLANDSYAEIGHASSGSHSGNITVDASGQVLVEGGGVDAVGVSFAVIGHGSGESPVVPSGGVSNSGDITVTGASVTVQGGAGSDFGTLYNAQIGHGFPGLGLGLGTGFTTGTLSNTGAITVTATAGAVTVAGGTSDDSGAGSAAMIGHGGLGFFNSTINGDDINGDAASIITVRATGNVIVAGGTGAGASAQIGSGGFGSVLEASVAGNVANVGAINVTSAGGSVDVTAGPGLEAYAQIGHGGFQATEPAKAASISNTGAITVTAANNVVVTGAGTGSLVGFFGGGAYAQIGHGGALTGSNLPEQAGPPVTTASIVNDGNITVAAQTGAVSLTGGAGDDGYAQIGHGGADAYANGNLTGVFQLSGDISVNAATAVSLAAGSGVHSYAQIGHGGAFLGNSAALTTIGDPASATPLSANSVSLTGNVTVSAAAGALALIAGSGADSYAQIGHGGAEAFGSAVVHTNLSDTGAISVTAAQGGILLAGGGAPDAYAQIGHGGALFATNAILDSIKPNQGSETLGDASSAIAVSSGSASNPGSIALTGGGSAAAPAPGAYAQIGNGGFEQNLNTVATATVAGGVSDTGNIDVAINGLVGAGSLSLTGGNGGANGIASGAYAQIGHGGDNANPAGTGLFPIANFQLGGSTQQTIVSVPGSLALTGGSGGLGDYAAISNFAPGGNGLGQGNLFVNARDTTTLTLGKLFPVIGNAVGSLTLLSGSFAVVEGGITTTDTIAGDFQGLVNQALAAGDVVIGKTGLGTLSVPSAIENNNASTLTLLAANDIDVTATIQSGNGLNLVAGWNGATGLINGTFSITPLLGNLAAFGQNTGSVLIDSSAVGSRSGTIAVLGANVTVQATNGFADIGSTFDNATGNIVVQATGTVRVQGGDVSGAFAQIGSGPAIILSKTNALTAASGNISVTAQGDVDVAGGSGVGASAQIGHGGTVDQNNPALPAVTLGGDIAVTATTGLVKVQGGTGAAAYAQIGHGGFEFAEGSLAPSITLTGNITVSAGSAVTIAGGIGAGGDAYAQIGHGGDHALAATTIAGDATLSGVIGVTAGTNIALLGGSQTFAYTQIGHGGFDFAEGSTVGGNATLTGAVAVAATAGTAALTGGAGANAFAQIGDGGNGALGNSTVTGSVDTTGAVTVASNLGVGLAGGAGTASYAQIGLGGAGADGSITAGSILDNGAITVNTPGGAIALAGGVGQQAYAQIGHGGDSANAEVTVPRTPAGTIIASGDITLGAESVALTGGGVQSYAQIGHGGRLYGSASDAQSLQLSGNVTVTATTGDIALLGDGSAAYAQIGHGGFNANNGADVLGGGTITASGTIAVLATNGSVSLAGGGAADAYAQIGHGGDAYDIDTTAGVTSLSGGITVTAGAAPAAAAGGVATGLALIAGTGTGAYAQIGHGGLLANADGNNHTADRAGAITLNVSGDRIALAGGGTGASAYAQIGHGGLGSVTGNLITDTTMTGDILFNLANPGKTGVSLAGGFAADTYAQIGHGGSHIGDEGATGTPTVTGAISLLGAGPVTLAAGVGTNADAQIGHGGFNFFNLDNTESNPATVAGDITIGSTALSLSGNVAAGTYAQIGHGGENFFQGVPFAVTVTGNITVEASAVDLSSGRGAGSYAQIGLGGSNALAGTTGATLTGNVFLTSANATNLSNGTGGSAVIGPVAAAGTIAGGTTLVTGSFSVDDDATNLIDTPMAAMLIADLAAGNVVLATTGGIDLTLGVPIAWATPHALSLLAAGNINANAAGVTITNNSAAPGAEIDLVAGWDGSGIANGALNIAALQGNPASFGNNAALVNVPVTQDAAGNPIAGNITMATNTIVILPPLAAPPPAGGGAGGAGAGGAGGAGAGGAGGAGAGGAGAGGAGGAGAGGAAGGGGAGAGGAGGGGAPAGGGTPPAGGETTTAASSPTTDPATAGAIVATVSPRPTQDTTPPAPEPPAPPVPNAAQLAAIAPAAGSSTVPDTTDGSAVETDSLATAIANSLEKGPAPQDEATQGPTAGDQPVIGGGLLFQAKPRVRANGAQGTASNGRNGSSAEQDVSGWGNESLWQ